MSDVVKAFSAILHGIASLLLLASRGLDDLADHLHGGYLIGALIAGALLWAIRPAFMRHGAEK